MDNVEDLRTAVGFGMGTKTLDNELIADAFIMGAGAATGMAAGILNLDPATTVDLAAKIFAVVDTVVGGEKN
jgi:hypothetical protein